jgi:hypothetical protein
MGERRGAFSHFVKKPAVKRPLGRPRPTWEDNIRTDLKEIGLEGVVCIDLTQDINMWQAVLKTATNLRVPSNAGNFSNR